MKTTYRPHSPRRPARTPFSRGQQGQAMSEYLVASLVVLLLLLGAGRAEGDGSVIEQLLDATAAAFERFSHFISLPL